MKSNMTGVCICGMLGLNGDAYCRNTIIVIIGNEQVT